MDIVRAGVDALLATKALSGRRVAAVWLFGSYARGNATLTSDLDLAVLCDPPLGAARVVTMDEVARAVGREVDVIDMATAPPALAWEIITTGGILRELDDLAVERFVRAARYAAEDDEQRSRMVLLAQVGTVGGASR